MIHCSPASEPPISRWMTGSATLTIVTSSWTTKKPRHTEISAAAAARRVRGSLVPVRVLVLVLAWLMRAWLALAWLESSRRLARISVELRG